MSDLTNQNECARFPSGGTLTTAYADKPYTERFSVMGVPAETAFEQWASANDVVIQRFGFDRSPLPKEAMLQLPLFVRHAPDYILFNAGWTYFVDCVGTANPQGFKVRATKLDTLGFYAREGGDPLLFVYCSTTDSYAFINYDVVQRTKGPLEHFAQDGNAYHFVPQTAWVPVPRG